MKRDFVYKKKISTPIGEMLACATNEGVCFLDFLDRKNYEKLFSSIKTMLNAEIVDITNHTNSNAYNIIVNLEKELKEYFDKKRKEFTIPIITIGTPFQMRVWDELLNIPYGKTISYKEEAERINHKKAIRAVANANGKNKISILIPCHRVIATNGKLGGYGGGLDRKEFLLSLEKE